MKKLFAAIALIALTGFGCATTQSSAPAGEKSSTYQNTQYGYAFDYPEHDEVHVRDEAVRPDLYLKHPVDFYASLRDAHRPKEEKPVNLAYFFAAKDWTLAQFKQALLESGPNVAVKSMEPVVINHVTFTKVVSTTDLGIDKIHYLLDRNGTLLVFNVFIREDANFENVFKTFRER